MISFKYDPGLKTNGTWQWAYKEDGTRTALWRCPNGHISSLYRHDISDTGLVVPSVVCSHEGCDFCDWVKLENWAGKIS